MRRRKKNKNTGRTKKIALGGILTALAMIFSYIESLIPIPLPVPGVKLGIANIAIISVLYLLGSGQALLVNLLRITLTAVLFGNFNSFLFSMAGGMLSLLVMVILKKSGHFFHCRCECGRRCLPQCRSDYGGSLFNGYYGDLLLSAGTFNLWYCNGNYYRINGQLCDTARISGGW
mgnify:CR=1 FL=1